MRARRKTNGRIKDPVPRGIRTFLRATMAVSPAVAAAVAERLFLRTRRLPVPRRELEVLAGASPVRLTGADGPIPAWLWSPHGAAAAPSPADAPAVALVHGWEGRGSQLGAFVAPLLEAGFPVLTYDAPGHGAAGGRSSNLLAMTRTLEAVAERFGPFAGIVAHSAGSVVATHALSRGLSVERAVFIAPGAGLVDYSRTFARVVGVGEDLRRRVQERIERRLGLPWRELEPLELAPAMDTPLLVVSDRNDREAPLASVEALAGLWPGAALRVTEGLGHRRILRNPEVLTRAVGFLAEGSTDGSAPVSPPPIELRGPDAERR